jgi:hypothetical protein
LLRCSVPSCMVQSMHAKKMCWPRHQELACAKYLPLTEV